MKLRTRLAMLAGAGAMLCSAVAATMSPEPAQAFGNPRIIINVGGPQAGTIEFDNVSASFFPELLVNEDTGELLMPTNYCGLRVTRVGGIWWFDGSGQVVEAENHGEVNYVSGQGYMFMGEDITDSYLGGVEFTGALPTCDDNEPWYFPTPLSYGGNGPQYGVQKLVLELDPPTNFPSIEFLDQAHEPMELPDLFEDWEPPADWAEYCEKIPEFCEEEEEPKPDPTPWSGSTDILSGCTVFDPRDCPDYPSAEPFGITLGCLAYSIGCDPAPPPVGTLKVAVSPPAQNAELLVAPLKVVLPGAR